MMSFEPMEHTPPSRLGSHHLSFGGRRCRDVLQVEYLTPYLFSTGIQRRETLFCLPHSFEWGFVLYGWGVTFLNRAPDIRESLFNIASLVFWISFFAFDVALRPSGYFIQCDWWSLGEGFIEVSCLESIFEPPRPFPMQTFLILEG